MGLLYKSEHWACPNYDKTDKPAIEVVKIVKGIKDKLSVANNEIVFVIEGRFRYCYRDFPSCEVVKGQVIFRPAGGEYACEALSDSMAVIFRLHQPVCLCDNFSMEKLYGIRAAGPEYAQDGETQRVGTLEINSRLWYFLDGVIDCISDGLKCRCWFDLKIRELFLLLRAYYMKEELHDFFRLILSGDTAFSEYVRLNRQRYNSVGKMAASMNITPKQFSTRFAKVFGQTPYRWMLEGRAQQAYKEITSTDKPFKQIALDNAFSDDTQLIRFCRKQFGKTPSEIRAEAGNGENKQGKR